MVLVVHAHPYPARSVAGAELLAALEGVPGLEVRSLYRLYPDFDIDAEAERRALERARLVVLLHPLYWYAAPALLKHWFDVVLAKGWAYGEGGSALAGKDCLWAVTTGGEEAEYGPEGSHGRPFGDFAPAIEQTARFCGMNWLEPFVVNAARRATPQARSDAGRRLRARIEERLA